MNIIWSYVCSNVIKFGDGYYIIIGLHHWNQVQRPILHTGAAVYKYNRFEIRSIAYRSILMQYTVFKILNIAYMSSIASSVVKLAKQMVWRSSDTSLIVRHTSGLRYPQHIYTHIIHLIHYKTNIITEDVLTKQYTPLLI